VSGEPIRFERSLSLDDAQGSGALLAYAMNGEALPMVHGYPLRVIVPGWYAVASVKWLTQIDMISDRFSGHYQTEAYFYEWQRGGQLIREPLSLQRVRSLITEPEPTPKSSRASCRSAVSPGPVRHLLPESKSALAVVLGNTLA